MKKKIKKFFDIDYLAGEPPLSQEEEIEFSAFISNLKEKNADAKTKVSKTKKLLIKKKKI